jgi:hypothetical protein
LQFGFALLEADRIDDAAQRAAGALEASRATGRRMSEAAAHGLLGEVAMHRDPVDYAEMERHVLNSLRLAQVLEMRPLAARCHLRLAWIYERTGRDCDRQVKAATALLQEIGNPRSLDAAAVT